jgi:hypothetical protein
VKYFFTVLLLITAAGFIQIACTKVDTTTLGSNLIPVVDNVNTFDTTLEVQTDLFALPDSTLIPSNADHALGTLHDGFFGTTTAGIYVSLSPASGYAVHPFGNKDSVADADIDSVMLQLAYTSIVHGDTNSTINFQVQEIQTGTPNKFKDTAFRINTPPSFFGSGTIWGNIAQPIALLNDNKQVGSKINQSVTITNVMRIPLSTALGVRLKNYDSTSATNFAYFNDSAFRAKFQGLSITPTSSAGLNSGALAYFNLRNSNSKLIVYYKSKKTANPTGKDTLETAYTFANFGHANTIVRNNLYNYASTLASGVANEPVLYLQSSPGSYATVKIPGLKNLPNYTVHRAELIIEKVADPAQSADYPFDPPPLLFLDAIDSANSNRPTCIPNDFIFNSAAALGYDVFIFGGSQRNKSYRFNLSRYVQGIITRKDPSYTLRLYAPYTTQPYYQFLGNFLNTPLFISQTIGYGRVVLAGGAYPDPTRKMRLRIIYSKI